VLLPAIMDNSAHPVSFASRTTPIYFVTIVDFGLTDAPGEKDKVSQPFQCLSDVRLVAHRDQYSVRI
jgi:hypothetical protein